jgi:4-hydroxyacetophenone monooxygenase
MVQLQKDPTAYLGVAVPNFPNLFLLMGPNSVLAHNTATFMIECQANYVADCIRETIQSGADIHFVRQRSWSMHLSFR